MNTSHRGITPNSMAGFTLIELMIVIVVIAILASIGYPSYTQYIARSHRQGLVGHVLARWDAHHHGGHRDGRSLESGRGRAR